MRLRELSGCVALIGGVLFLGNCRPAAADSHTLSIGVSGAEGGDTDGGTAAYNLSGDASYSGDDGGGSIHAYGGGIIGGIGNGYDHIHTLVAPWGQITSSTYEHGVAHFACTMPSNAVSQTPVATVGAQWDVGGPTTHHYLTQGSWKCYWVANINDPDPLVPFLQVDVNLDGNGIVDVYRDGVLDEEYTVDMQSQTLPVKESHGPGVKTSNGYIRVRYWVSDEIWTPGTSDPPNTWVSGSGYLSWGVAPTDGVTLWEPTP